MNKPIITFDYDSNKKIWKLVSFEHGKEVVLGEYSTLRQAEAEARFIRKLRK